MEENINHSYTIYMLALLLLITFTFAGAYSGSQERRLLNDLLELYNSLERPVYNDTDAINLTFGLTLQQIIDVVKKYI